MRAVAIAVVLAGCRPAPVGAPLIGNRAGDGPRDAPRLLARVPLPTRAMIAQPRAAFLTATTAPAPGSCEEQLWYAWRGGLEHLAQVAATLGTPPRGLCAATAEHAIAAVALVMTRNDRGTRNDAWRRGLAWTIAARVASSPARARIAQRNLAEARWDHAWRSPDDSAAWVEAADAFATLADAGDPEAASAEAAAWVNAVVTEIRVTDGDPDRALVARALERARALPPDGAARVRAVAADPRRTKPAGSAHKPRAPY